MSYSPHAEFLSLARSAPQAAHLHRGRTACTRWLDCLRSERSLHEVLDKLQAPRDEQHDWKLQRSVRVYHAYPIYATSLLWNVFQIDFCFY